MWNLRLLSVLRDRYYSSNVRKQLAILLGILALSFFILFQFIFAPLNDKSTSMESSVKGKEKDLLKLKEMTVQYKRLEQYKSVDGQKGEGEPFNLFSILDKLANESKLTENIDYMKPGNTQLDSLREEKWVEMKLSRVTLNELTRFLYNLGAFEKEIYIKRLSAKKEGDYLNLILQPAVVEMR